jgi:hypothetical protein
MTDLETQLEAAKTANPNERIEWRDRIAAHGAQAVPAMREWLEDSRLGAFAVTVLAAIAKQPGLRRTVLDAFESAGPDNLAEPVARDVADAIGRIGGVPQAKAGHAKGTRTSQAGEWPGPRIVSPLERRFHQAMLDIFRLAGEATRRQRPDGSTARGYWPSRFLQAVKNRGGPDYARKLLHAKDTSAGFQRLAEEGKLEFTVEALVQDPDYADLFTAEERMEAARRLRGRYGPSRG